MIIFVRDPLLRSHVFKIITVSILVSFVISIAEIGFDYRTERKKAIRTVESVINNSEWALDGIVFNINESEAQKAVNSLLENKIINKVVIYDSYEKQIAGATKIDEGVKYKKGFYRDDLGFIGRIEVLVDDSQFINEFIFRSLLNFAGGMIKTLIFIGVILFVTKNNILLPLRDILNKINLFDENKFKKNSSNRSDIIGDISNTLDSAIIKKLRDLDKKNKLIVENEIALKRSLEEKRKIIRITTNLIDQKNNDFITTIHNEINPEILAAVWVLEKLIDEGGFRNHALNDALEFISSAYDKCRDLSANIKPDIEDVGLIGAFQQICKFYQKSKKINFSVQGDYVDKNKEIENNIFIIAKEAILNAVKHSQCTTISISVSQDNEKVVVVVADNGQGFEKNSQDGFGILMMRGYADSIGFKLVIDSNRNGTSITISGKLT